MWRTSVASSSFTLLSTTTTLVEPGGASRPVHHARTRSCSAVDVLALPSREPAYATLVFSSDDMRNTNISIDGHRVLTVTSAANRSWTDVFESAGQRLVRITYSLLLSHKITWSGKPAQNLRHWLPGWNKLPAILCASDGTMYLFQLDTACRLVIYHGSTSYDPVAWYIPQTSSSLACFAITREAALVRDELVIALLVLRKHGALGSNSKKPAGAVEFEPIRKSLGSSCTDVSYLPEDDGHWSFKKVDPVD